MKNKAGQHCVHIQAFCLFTVNWLSSLYIHSRSVVELPQENDLGKKNLACVLKDVYFN